MAELSSEEIERIKKTAIQSIGQNIRRKRKEKGLTQVELANRIHSDRQYLYKIETARVGVSISKLAVIAAALNIPLSELTTVPSDESRKPE